MWGNIKKYFNILMLKLNTELRKKAKKCFCFKEI